MLWRQTFPEDIDELAAKFEGKPLRERSLGNIKQVLCRLLGFHKREMPFMLERPFAERFDEDVLILLVDDLADECANENIRDYLKHLKRYLKRSVGVEYVWFDRILRDLSRSTTSEHRLPLPISSPQIMDRATAYMSDALADLGPSSGWTRSYTAQKRFRNGYLVYFLSQRPQRLANVAQLVLGQPVLQQPRGFEIRFPGKLMKKAIPARL